MPHPSRNALRRQGRARAQGAHTGRARITPGSASTGSGSRITPPAPDPEAAPTGQLHRDRERAAAGIGIASRSAEAGPSGGTSRTDEPQRSAWRHRLGLPVPQAGRRPGRSAAPSEPGSRSKPGHRWHQQDRRAAAFRVAASSRASRPASGPTPWTIRSTVRAGSRSKPGHRWHQQDRRAAAFRVAHRLGFPSRKRADALDDPQHRQTGQQIEAGPQVAPAGRRAAAFRVAASSGLPDPQAGRRPGRSSVRAQQIGRATGGTSTTDEPFRVAASSRASVPASGPTPWTIRSTVRAGQQIEAGPQVAPAGPTSRSVPRGGIV